ncbi:hypothetical protein BU25DRAFT_412639, partial [Macroventuria anomochaeta]
MPGSHFTIHLSHSTIVFSLPLLIRCLTTSPYTPLHNHYINPALHRTQRLDPLRSDETTQTQCRLSAPLTWIAVGCGC